MGDLIIIIMVWVLQLGRLLFGPCHLGELGSGCALKDVDVRWLISDRVMSSESVSELVCWPWSGSAEACQLGGVGLLGLRTTPTVTVTVLSIRMLLCCQSMEKRWLGRPVLLTVGMPVVWCMLA